MKNTLLFGLVLILFSCQTVSSEQESQSQPTPKPKVSFTFDDGITRDLAGYKFEDWNGRILSALEAEDLTAVFFVMGRNKLDEKGKYLLESWADKGHMIANHTFTHPNFNNETLTVADFETELIKTDRVISAYDTYAKLFRFPYLKEGNTEEKIAGFRRVLSEYGYRNGYVTIDASDWYIDGQLKTCIQEEGMESPRIEVYRQFYLQHILERAAYYESLSYRMNDRNIPHTLLLHHNLTSALFLPDLIRAFKEAGWEVMDADKAFQDEIFDRIPDVNPAGESLIWSLAKESGKYEDELRYPAEDSRYEIPKMRALGI